MPERANEISGLMVMAISGGAAILPIIGLFSTYIGVAAGFYVLVVVMLFILFSGFYSLKH